MHDQYLRKWAVTINNFVMSTNFQTIITMIKNNTVFTLLAVMLSFCVSCNSETAAEKAKNTINNTGRSLGRGTSQFIKGVKEGVDKTIQCTVEVSPALKSQGISFGKFFISQSKGASDNILTIYLIFDGDFNRKISVKVFDKKGQEYGRTSAIVEGKSGQAYNVDFVFDPRTEIEAKSKFMLY